MLEDGRQYTEMKEVLIKVYGSIIVEDLTWIQLIIWICLSKNFWMKITVKE